VLSAIYNAENTSRSEYGFWGMNTITEAAHRSMNIDTKYE